MNMEQWNALSPEVQDELMSAIETEFEDPAWATAQDALENDIACLTGNGECPYGEARDMTLVEATDEDFERARTILVEEVLPEWADRAGEDAAKRWNASVGEVTGVTVPLN
jgi:hypothetical protein